MLDNREIKSNVQCCRGKSSEQQTAWHLASSQHWVLVPDRTKLHLEDAEAGRLTTTPGQGRHTRRPLQQIRRPLCQAGRSPHREAAIGGHYARLGGHHTRRLLQEATMPSWEVTITGGCYGRPLLQARRLHGRTLLQKTTMPG
eukprot:g39851.t1